MLPILTACSVIIGLVCGRLYSFVAVLLTGPLLAMVACFAALERGWGTPSALVTGAATMALSQLAFLAGVRLRVDRASARDGKARPRPEAIGEPHRVGPGETRLG